MTASPENVLLQERSGIAGKNLRVEPDGEAMKGKTAGIAPFALLIVLALTSCSTTTENNAIEDRPLETDAAEAVTCDVDIPAGQEVDDELVAILPEAAEILERIEVGNCGRALAGARSLFDTPEAAAALTGSNLGEHLQEGVGHYFFHPQGFSTGGVRARVWVFEGPAAARKALRLLRPALLETMNRVTDPLEPPREIPLRQLGDRSFGIRGSIASDFPQADVVRLVWSRDNLVLDLTGWGPVGEPDSAPVDGVLEIAGAMDARSS